MKNHKEPIRYIGAGKMNSVPGILREYDIKKPFLVCGPGIKHLTADAILTDILYVIFDEFSPNPVYKEAASATEQFLNNKCDGIIAIGGGSSIDLAKCVKLFSALDNSAPYIVQTYLNSEVKLVAMPTTAGTGSEETRFAVIYADGEKQSVQHQCLIPDIVVLDHTILRTLPDYQKKSAGLDALCQCMESLWSVKASPESREYAAYGLRLIFNSFDGYLNGNEKAAEDMLLGANYSGRAINISETTAAHALSYKITSLYGVSHGGAVAVCMPPILDILLENRDNPKILPALQQICDIFDCVTIGEILSKYDKFYKRLSMPPLPAITARDIQILAESVNTQRLDNFPVPLTKEDIRSIYIRIKGGNIS
jgi:alcohol dehydrogenase class IV